MLNKLIDTLEQEIVLYKDFLSLLQEEKKLLCSRKSGDLYRLAGRIETQVFKIKGMERKRNEIVDAIARMYALNGNAAGLSPAINLSGIITAAEKPHKELLKCLQSRLLAVVNSIKELNQENGIIINRSMENINKAFMFIKEFSLVKTYHSSGMIADPSSRGM
ncbi:MAG: flagellar protein FlgN [Deltaproteobacteria bacterium]|nr:flagellar protein FlgN [Deltaproteobacteria bacterium]